MLENELLRLSLTSHGAESQAPPSRAIPSAKARTNASPTTSATALPPPHRLQRPAPAAAFEVVAATSNSVTYRKTLHTGLTLQRTLTLGAHYQIKIAEQLTNTSDATLATHGQGIQAGFMHNLPGESQLRQGPTLGVDTLTGSAGVRYWGAKLDKWFPPNGNRASQTIPGPNAEPDPVDWVAVKNKYFTKSSHQTSPPNMCYHSRTRPASIHPSLFFPKPPSHRPGRCRLTYPGVESTPQTITCTPPLSAPV